eukprot:10264837-Alexandrium_andersonii.AAC.1
MGAAALEPEPSEFDVGSPELQAAYAVLQRAFRPGKGRGQGGSRRAPLASLGLRAVPRAQERVGRSPAVAGNATR